VPLVGRHQRDFAGQAHGFFGPQTEVRHGVQRELLQHDRSFPPRVVRRLPGSVAKALTEVVSNASPFGGDLVCRQA
jgi:hypothetical protein